ncbi:hypothetical protein O7602_28130 [Micromonospora sp. WMMD1128]|uniref:hypothetical protein n=1 Tax=Micromonospora sp. WMMD1128 TaxID=3015150 RepID=UPI00248B2988|nr:hypothetical protein [Micromonospora sp. WMMD1128]WBB73492.1 hypothetical protein O7602_28130 [Micromonospora sp. WMMD1128]
MTEAAGRAFREAAVSWRTVWNELYPEDNNDPHDDDYVTEMHRLRGLIMAQAAETETVLGMILVRLDPGQNVARPAGQLLRSIRQRLDEQRRLHWSTSLDLIYDAIKCRNKAVHRPVEVGSSWLPYSTGDGGEWVPVITLMCGQEYDVQDLRRDLALQHRATAEAVRLLRSLDG